MKRITLQILNYIARFFNKMSDQEAKRVIDFYNNILYLSLARGGEVLFEFGLVCVFRFIAELRESHNYERRKDEESDFCNNRINFTFDGKSLCLR
jgi:hypothetical protein